MGIWEILLIVACALIVISVGGTWVYKKIKGKPNNPHSQIVVERVHRSTKYALIRHDIEKKTNLNLKR